MNSPLHAAACLAPADFRALRLRTIFEHCKWDPQVEDAATLCPFPLVIDPQAWRQLSQWSVSLAAEALHAERELLGRPDLQRQLGLPRKLCRVLARGEPSAEIGRLMRFDFHWTTDGWRLSECNSDVPGGWIEAGGFTALMAQQVGDHVDLGRPGDEVARCFAAALPAGATVALVHATAYSDDAQVMHYLSSLLRERGLECLLAAPDHLRWSDGRAALRLRDQPPRTLDAVLRFFPGEWLVNLPASSGWHHFVGGSRTPLSNPGSALLIQSKRFPLVWDQLAAELPTWRALLPQTLDPRRADWSDESQWVLKPALGRVGEDIGISGVTPARQWRQIRRWARWWPRHWAAQRRFHVVPVDSPLGPVYPCLGVYTVDGRPAGVYGRVSHDPIISAKAMDCAVLQPAPSPAVAPVSMDLPAAVGSVR